MVKDDTSSISDQMSMVRYFVVAEEFVEFWYGKCSVEIIWIDQMSVHVLVVQIDKMTLFRNEQS